jgi:hypothetical protein
VSGGLASVGVVAGQLGERAAHLPAVAALQIQFEGTSVGALGGQADQVRRRGVGLERR